ncbi:MAG: DnaA ATPase domain-containing protein [Parvularculaceae bacterium]
MDDHHAFGMAEKFSVFQRNLRVRFGDDVFDQWMADLTLDDVSEDAVTLATPSPVKADRLNQQYKCRILNIWRENVSPVARVRIVPRHARRAALRNGSARADAKAATPGPDVRAPDVRRSARSADGVGANGARANGSQAAEAAASDLFTDFTPAAPRREYKRRPEEGGKKPTLSLILSPLDPRSTFSTFAVGPSNEVAHAAAHRVFSVNADREIVYIYGPSGIGKTHLLNAVAHEWRARWPGRPCAYLTYNAVKDGFSNATMTNSLRDFHAELRDRDLIIIDDLHRLVGSVRTQEEVLNLSNAFSSEGGQLVIAGELPPSRLAEAGLNRRLADRLAGGLPAPMERGGEQLRLKVLQKRRERANSACVVSDAALAFVARRFPQSMREAIGAFNQLILVYGERDMTVGVDEANAALKARLLDGAPRVSLQDLLGAAAAAFGLKAEDLTGRAQPQRIVRARHAFVLVGRDSLKESFPSLAKTLHRDHTTAMSSYNRAQALHERKEDFRDGVAKIRIELGL